MSGPAIFPPGGDSNAVLRTRCSVVRRAMSLTLDTQPGKDSEVATR